MKRRILSIITSLALCLSLCPTWAFATEADPSLCKHHPEHTEDCGYIAPTEGQPCGHEHTDECYTLGALPDTDSGDYYEIGADTENLLDCQHTHDSECGYAQADPGQPCGYECRICPIEDLIAALPDKVTEDNAEDVRGQLDEILALFSVLTEDEQEQIDLSRCYELQGALDGANDPAPITESVEYQEASWDGSQVTYESKTETCTPVESSAEAVTWTAGWYAVSGTVTISEPITVTGAVNLILTNGCTLTAEKGIVATSTNSLTIYAQSENGGTLNATGTTDDSGNASAGIGGSETAPDSGTITIHGGVINATGGGQSGRYGGAGIGGGTSRSGNGGNSGTIIIYGNTVTANSGEGSLTGAGIGGGGGLMGGGAGNNIQIYGGSVTASSTCTGTGGAGIGGGGGLMGGGAGNNIQIYGGTINATGSEGSAGIGGGGSNTIDDSSHKSGDGAVTISGGTVTAVGGNYAAGIGGGGGYYYSSQYSSGGCTGGTGSVTISGGIVDASSPTDVYWTGYEGAPIGNGGNTTAAATVSKTNAIVFENGAGTVCGDVTLNGSYTVPGDYTLNIPVGASLSGSGTLSGGNAFTTENLTEDMISVPTNLYYDGKDRTEYLTTELSGELDKGITICGQTFTVSGWTLAVAKTDDLTYTATYTNNNDNTNTFTKTITLQKSGTDLTSEGKVQTYKGDTLTKDFTASDTITVKATPTATGEAPAKAAARLRGNPTAGQMAVFVGDTQVSAPADKGADGAYTMTVSAADVLVAAGGPGTGITLTAKFVGNNNMADAAGTVPVNISAVAKVVNGSSTTFVGALADAFIEGNDGAIITLLSEVDLGANYISIDNTFTLDLNGQTVKATGSGAFNISGGSLTIQDSGTGGKIESSNITVSVIGGTLSIESGTVSGFYGVGIYGGTVNISGGVISGEEMGLWVRNSGKAVLSGGTLIGKSAVSINVDASVTLKNLLAEGYAYHRNNLPVTKAEGWVDSNTWGEVSLDTKALLTGTVTVKKCNHTGEGVCEYTHATGTTTHQQTCLACGRAAAAEKCSFDETGACPCGAALAVALPEDLNLIYDGTLQRPAVTVTVDGITTLEKGTDYGVYYLDSVNAGNTAKVTVTGTTFTGTFTLPFTIKPATPTLAWESTTQELTYTGNEAMITAPKATGVNGTQLGITHDTGPCQFSYATQGSSEFTNGLPINAGTYTIKASVAAKGNYAAAESTNTLTLTIRKAAPLTPKTGDLAVANKQEHTYTYGLGALRPDVPEGMSLGSTAVTYELGPVNLGSYYDSGAMIDGQTLTLPIKAVESDSETKIGTITVTIHTQNFEDMTATIDVRSVNKIIPTGGPNLSGTTLTYGQALSAITLSGNMKDGETPVPGKFEWSNPDNRPAVQENYAAAWIFTPDDNKTYAIVTGTALIQVLPAPITGVVIVLDHTAFKYDGQPHRPGITSVTLNGTPLTADVDYTAAIPEGTEAGTYTVTLTGKGNYTGTATAVFIINPVEQKPLDQKDDDGHELRLEVETGLSTVPEALKTNEQFNTPGKIETALRTRVAEVMSNVGEQIAVFDVTLQYKDESGVWRNVDPNHFPAEGVTAVLPYPAGTGATGYTFTVQHLISSGAQAGTMETLAYTPTADGLQCKFSSLSPVAIGYQAATKPNPQPNPGGNSGGGSGGGGWSSSTYAVTVEKSEHGKVTSNRTNASNGSTVTLTVTPDSGYVLDTLTVTDSRGNEIKLTAQSGGKYTFTMPSRAVTVKASFVPLPDDTQKPCDGGVDCPSRGFSDLGSVGTWYHEAVDYVLRNDLMGGYGNGLFGPNDNLSRAQFAQILFNKEGRPVVNYLLQYGDVAEGAWYTEAIRWATSRGIVGGYGNGTFGPNDNITREQLAVMLWRYAGSPAATDKELHFTDADQASGFALEALRWAVENGIINGYGDGQLAPQGLATRGQVAQMLMNFLKNR
ncbi:hypothetical protein N510_001285 [Firmicutes bacterium ASF500]|nr:hypothetical protein N510_001285 [Firmicutes bacterium ASF500]